MKKRPLPQDLFVIRGDSLSPIDVRLLRDKILRTHPFPRFLPLDTKCRARIEGLGTSCLATAPYTKISRGGLPNFAGVEWLFACIYLVLLKIPENFDPNWEQDCVLPASLLIFSEERSCDPKSSRAQGKSVDHAVFLFLVYWAYFINKNRCFRTFWS